MITSLWESLKTAQTRTHCMTFFFLFGKQHFSKKKQTKEIQFDSKLVWHIKGRDCILSLWLCCSFLMFIAAVLNRLVQ